MNSIAVPSVKVRSAAEVKPSAALPLAGLSLSMLLASLGTSIANVSLPTVAAAFDASFRQVQWVVLAYLLTLTCVIVPVGRIADLAGRRRLLTIGITVFTIGSVLGGLAPVLWALNAARVVQGAGAAMMMAAALALVSETVPREKMGRAMGLLGTTSAVGTAMGPSIGGILISEFGWRSVFFFTVPLGVLALFLVLRYLPLDRRSMRCSKQRTTPPS